jgi:hypothetical protein
MGRWSRRPSLRQGNCVPDQDTKTPPAHLTLIYEVRPRKDHRGVDLISDALPFGGLCYAEPNAISNAIGYAKFYSPSHDAVIRVFDEAGNVIETHEAYTSRVTVFGPSH